MVESKLIVVTGGAGYIGSVLVRALLQRGYRVRVLDNLRWSGESLASVMHRDGFALQQGDICDAHDVERALQGAHAVVHLAAIVGDPACRAEPEMATAINLHASITLFDASLRHGIARFISVSTCSNYGRMVDPLIACDEDAELRPVSLYAELKVQFERYLLESAGAICATSLRFATAYGLSPRMRFDLTLNEFVRDVTAGRPLVVFGENTWRPYCHTTDLARACVHVLEAEAVAVNRQAFNIGDDQENYQKRRLLEEIEKQCPDLSYRFVPQTDDPRDYRVSFQKIRKLGFEVSTRVPDGIREIRQAIETGAIRDPYDPKYSNLRQ